MNGEVSITHSGNTERYVKKLYNLDGSYAGTISVTRPNNKTRSGQKKKSPGYSFKRISAMVLNVKTSAKATQAAAAIQRQIGALYKKRKTDEYDDEEVLRAILHAEQVRRACVKKKKNLEMEEAAEQKLDDKTVPADGDDAKEEAASDEEIHELEQEEFQALMEKLELSEDDIMEEAEETAGFYSELDDMAEALSGGMEPEDLSELKAKHRSEEERDIMRADLKYLKALFERLQSEKDNAGKNAASFFSEYRSGVSLSLGGMELPVISQKEVAADTGTVLDLEV